jgi:putative glutamine amidotransferase
MHSLRRPLILRCALMSRPVIGLCTALERAQWSVWDQPAVLLPRNYVDAV